MNILHLVSFCSSLSDRGESVGSAEELRGRGKSLLSVEAVRVSSHLYSSAIENDLE